jgi:hypothetical protein
LVDFEDDVGVGSVGWVGMTWMSERQKMVPKTKFCMIAVEIELKEEKKENYRKLIASLFT